MTNTLNILVADDNTINQQYFFMAIKKLGHNVKNAENGLVAIQLAQEFTFDLILMDIRMPELGGKEAAEEIRLIHSYQNTPIIAISAEFCSQCKADVFNGFILKPVSPKALKQHIDNYCQTKNKGGLKTFNKENAMSYAYNDEQIMHKLIQMFIKDLTVQINNLCIACQRSESKACIDLIHKLRGSCKTCGAQILDHSLVELSKVIATNDTFKINQQLQIIKQSAAKFLKLNHTIES